MTTLRFTDLALAPAVIDALNDVGYEQPSPIQAESIPALLQGSDIIGMAQTGTGKTAAFALPTLSNLDLRNHSPQVLVLAPTRELAIQVSEAFQRYASHLKGFKVLPIYGGQGMGDQLRALKRGVHVVVGTPGRVMDHLRRGTLKLDTLKTVVLDEADEMLRMGFIDDVTWILDQTPEKRQVALFSATMPNVIRKVAQSYLHDPIEVKIKAETATVEKIEQFAWTVRGTSKLDALTRILEVEEFDGIIIFVRTKSSTTDLAERIEARGYTAAALNGDMNQQLRERTIQRLKDGKIDILIATDVAARGIDVARVSHVINFDIPYDSEAYVHRIGRTGRAGRSGKAILFVAPRERRLLSAIERATKQRINTLELPSSEEVTEQRIGQFQQEVIEVAQNENLKRYTKILEQLQQDESIDLEKIALALTHIAQRSRPLFPSKKDKKQDKASKNDLSRKDRGEQNKTRRGQDKTRRGQDKSRRDSRDANVDFSSYRIDVGHNEAATPREIVGAIANEGELGSEFIGSIKIFDEHSTVELPSDLPKATMQTLRKTWVCGKQLNIELQKGGGRIKRNANKDKSAKKRNKPKRGNAANKSSKPSTSTRSPATKSSAAKKTTRGKRDND